MPNTTCNFFAILKNDSIKKIDLLQTITESIRNVFVNASLHLINDDTEEILFDGNYAVQEEEVLFVNLELPINLTNATSNPIGLGVLDINIDQIKTLFWFENGVYYFQNFDNRKLLQNRNIIFWDETSFNKFTENALIVENYINGLYKDNKFYFNNFVNANKIFNLSSFYQEATDKEITEFVKNDNISINLDWLLKNSNSLLRKQITLLEKSGILKNTNTKKVKISANHFKLKIELTTDGKLILPENKKDCKNVLAFLNEQYYFGVITKINLCQILKKL
ncbi:DUF4868 domain-containing protein [Flavobacterium psychrophilum]|uniref:Kiwa anti-phage protein KwaB-like domain-containing protein n=1 Tax=Flavobacterium psychrophilum TaxID=96345 RepID=UPI0015DFE64C|nr:Kiwa anti-phage protein KwaB-like domain-containing protein [Flavobacterium psychrophilum]QLK34214.1 DUF4868 domain-containing protein [Flavobacterium psychrophilum]